MAVIMKMKKHVIIAAYLLFAVLVTNTFFPAVWILPAFAEEVPSVESDSFPEGGYRAYYSSVSARNKPFAPVVIEGESAVNTGDSDEIAEDARFSGGKALRTVEDGVCEWVFTVGEPGLYQLEVIYSSLSANRRAAVRSLALNGETPFSEASHINFTRLFTDELEDGGFREDAYGNQIAPASREEDVMLSVWADDVSGKTAEPFYFDLQAGENRLRLTAVTETLVIDRLTFTQCKTPPGYAEYLNQHKDAPVRGNEQVYLEAEKPSAKSDDYIAPAGDRRSALTSPKGVSGITLNIIGGSKWQKPGQWISWDFTVPADGLYHIIVRYRQDTLSGAFVSRRLTIDGEVPFREAESLLSDRLNTSIQCN